MWMIGKTLLSMLAPRYWYNGFLHHSGIAKLAETKRLSIDNYLSDFNVCSMQMIGMMLPSLLTLQPEPVIMTSLLASQLTCKC